MLSKGWKSSLETQHGDCSMSTWKPLGGIFNQNVRLGGGLRFGKFASQALRNFRRVFSWLAVVKAANPIGLPL